MNELSIQAILKVLEISYSAYLQVREWAKNQGISDEEMADVTAKYDERIARREKEISGE